MSDGADLLHAAAGDAGHRPHANLQPSRREWLAVGAVVLSLYAVACACSAYYDPGFAFDGPAVGHAVPGWKVLAVGWLLGLLYPPAFILWSANLLLLGGWVAYGRGRFGRAAAYGAVAAAAGFAAFAMPQSEVERLLLGYYLWQASLVCFALVSAWRWRCSRARLPFARGSIAEPFAAADRGRDYDFASNEVSPRGPGG